MELKLENLTTEQKIGMLLTGTFYHGDEDIEYTMDLIRQRKLGAAWVNIGDPRRDDLIKKIRDAADYPIIICSDAETGYGEYTTAQAISLAFAGGDPALGYSLGKTTGVQLRALGYDLIFNPVLDICTQNGPCGTTTRGYGNDKEKVAEMGIAIGKGMHDGGLLTGGKHYPGNGNCPVDTHMQEGLCPDTEEELVDFALYPYIKMNEAGLLDAVMVGHVKFPNVDPDNPSSLSKPVMDILRRQGFDGTYMTDALTMMGIVLKYGQYACNGLAAAAGNEFVLPWGISNKEAYEALKEAYKTGVLTDERLDEACRRILTLQHKATVLAAEAHATITKEDDECFRRINEDCIVRYVGEGVNPTIDKNGKHLFIILADNDFDAKVLLDAPIGPAAWYNFGKMTEKIKQTFPNSDTMFLRLYPSVSENSQLFNKQLEYDDVVYITYWQTIAYLGDECLSSRVLSVMRALQTTNRIAAIIHFGNPYMMEDVPHVDRILTGCCSTRCILHSFDVLCGNAPANGVPVYKLNLK